MKKPINPNYLEFKQPKHLFVPYSRVLRSRLGQIRKLTPTKCILENNKCLVGHHQMLHLPKISHYVKYRNYFGEKGEIMMLVKNKNLFRDILYTTLFPN